MKKLLLTGATDGIGRLTAHRLVAAGHHVLLHGRNAAKLAALADELGGTTSTYVADLSQLEQVDAMAAAIRGDHDRLDVLINNAGVLKTSQPRTPSGLDVRFVVNTVAPYLLTKRLLPLMGSDGRVVNLSSAAQAPVDLDALLGRVQLRDDMGPYAQSKLAITLWTSVMAAAHTDGPLFVSVNPGSLLGTKMVREGFGMAGKDVSIGADILVEAATGDRFLGRSGAYFDNDANRFGPPHPAARQPQHVAEVMGALEGLLPADARGEVTP